MKAVVFDPNTITPIFTSEWEMPVPAEGEILIRLHAAALNHRDLNITHPKNKVPFVYGSDGAGVIEKVGAGVTDWTGGEEVLLSSMVACLHCRYCLTGDHALCENQKVLGGVAWGGTFAQYIKVPARNVVKKPEHLTMEQAASLPMAFGTAWRALVTQAKLKPAETVLIQGIGGGVAVACLQIATAMGARVIVTSGSSEKLRKALAMGAYAAINYKEEDVAQGVKELTDGQGVNVVVASSGEVISTSIQAAGKAGRIVQFAYVGQMLPAVDVDQMMFKQLSLIGSAMHTYSEFDAAMTFVDQQKLVPFVSEVLPLEDFQVAFQRMKEAAQFGKLVLSIPQS